VRSSGSNVNCYFLTGEVGTATDDLFSDISKQEFCALVSDVSDDGKKAELTSSHDPLPASAISSSAVTGNGTTDSSSDVTSSMQESIVEGTTVPDILRRGAEASTSVVQNANPTTPLSFSLGNTAGNPAVSENSAISGNSSLLGNPAASAPQTMTVREYCQAFEQWSWQYYWWMQHVQWMTWAAYMSSPVYTPVSCIPSTGTQSVPQAAGTSAVPGAPPVAFQQPPAQQQQMQQPRGNTRQ